MIVRDSVVWLRIAWDITELLSISTVFLRICWDCIVFLRIAQECGIERTDFNMLYID